MNNVFINTTVNRKIRVRIDLFETIAPMFNLDGEGDLTTIDCNVTYLKSGRVVPASAQIFPTFADAAQYIETLKRGKGNFVANGLFSLKSHGYGIAIVERLRSLAGWVTNTNKAFWKTKVDNDTNVEQTLGFGEGFLPLLEGTLEGLSTLHGAGLWHGNLLKGIHVGLDNKIKLNNFAQPSMIPHSVAAGNIIDDFKSVRTMCELMVAEDPPLTQPKQLDIFYEFFNFEKYKILNPSYNFMEDLQIIAKFLYKLPLMWKSSPIGLLFELIDPHSKRLRTTDRARIIRALEIDEYFEKGWGKKLKCTTLKQVYWFGWSQKRTFPTAEEMRKRTTKPKNIGYRVNVKHAILHFARNTAHHAGFSIDEGVNFLLNEFPAISLIFYLELLRADTLKNEVVFNDGPMQFQEHAAKTLFYGNLPVLN